MWEILATSQKVIEIFAVLTKKECDFSCEKSRSETPAGVSERLIKHTFRFAYSAE